MKFLKAFIILALGVAVGAAGGGYFGYHIGKTDHRIDTAPSATVIPVQQETHQAQAPAAPAAPASAPETAPAAPSETPVNTPAVEPAPQPSAQPEAATAKIEEFNILPNDQSQIMWLGYKTVLGQEISMEGGFANFSGKITVEGEDPNKSFVEVVVDMKSIFSESSILTTVLKTDIFFDIAKYPEAKFVSTKVEPAANGYLVTGNFTVKGITQGIQFPAVIERRPEGAFAKAEFTVDRKLWNVGYDEYEDSVILNKVVISFEVLAEAAK